MCIMCIHDPPNILPLFEKIRRLIPFLRFSKSDKFNPIYLGENSLLEEKTFSLNELFR